MSIKSNISPFCEKVASGDQCEWLRMKHFAFIAPTPFCLGYGEKLKEKKCRSQATLVLKCRKCRVQAKGERQIEKIKTGYFNKIKESL